MNAEPDSATPAREETSSHLAYLFLTLMPLFIAINYVLGRSVRGVIPPVGLSFWRWLVGGLILAPFVLSRPRALDRIFGRRAGVLLLLGALLVGSTTLILVALNTVTAIDVSVINAFQPGLTALFAWVFLRESMTGKQLLGVGAACAGVLIMLSRGHWATLTGFDLSGGGLIALLGICGLAAYALNLHRIPPELSFAEALFGIIVMGSLTLLPFYLAESHFVATVPPGMKTLVVVFTLALLASVLAMLMWNFGNHHIGPTRATVFINLIPVFGVILAAAFLGESVHGYQVAGAVSIVVGIRLAVNKS